jgi:hypothetical protein
LSGVKTDLKSKALPILNSTISNDFCELIYEVLILGYASVTPVGILTTIMTKNDLNIRVVQLRLIFFLKDLAHFRD